MDMMTIGSLNSYTKSLKLETQWNMKKASGDVTAHSKSFDRLLERGQVAAMYQNQLDEAREQGTDKLSQVVNKMYAGGKLTPQERQLLKEKAPEDYDRLVEAEQRQQAFERDLKRCKTKEDVQRLKMRYASESLSRVNAVGNNSNIPDDKKLKQLRGENLKCMKYEQTTHTFVASGEYAKLPTDEEKRQVEQDEREIEEAKARVPEDEDENEETGIDGKAGKTEPERTAKELPEEQSKTKLERKIGEQSPERWRPIQVGPDGQLNSPEARKVRRARAKAAHAGASSAEPPLAPELTPRVQKNPPSPASTRQDKAKAAYAASAGEQSRIPEPTWQIRA